MSGKQLVRRLLVYAVQHAVVVASALIFAGYVGLFLLPLASRDNFFDENSLLVANSVPDVWNHAKKHQSHLIQQSDFQSTRQLLHTVPLDQLLQRHGLSAARQEFLSPSGNVTCTNYHVSTPSGRGDGSESLALVTPISAGCARVSSEALGSFREACWHQSQVAGVAAVHVGIILSNYLASVPWLARDFHWVIPDASCGLIHSTAAWVDSARGYRQPGAQHAGSIGVGLLQQALVLELHSMDGKAVEVSGVGFHGLLPKLDFFMLAEHFFRVDARTHVQLPWRPSPLLQAVEALLSMLDAGKYGDRLLGMLSFLGMQVGGNPDGAHAAFKDYAVDAVTAGGQAAADEVTGSKVLRLASAVESVLRCSNNLLERLHHSYFMYLQPNPKVFITIEAYVLPAVLMLLGLFLLAVSMLMPVHQPTASPPQAVPAHEVAAGGDAAPGGGGAAEGSAGSCERPSLKVFPEKARQPIRLQGGWPELSRGFCSVVSVHSLCAAAGLALHWALAVRAGGHEVWDSMGADMSGQVLVTGAVSAGGLVGLLVTTAAAPQAGGPSRAAALVERSIGILFTVLLMAAWMFVNWTDVYMALMCLVPNLLAASWRGAHHLSLILGMGWLVVNPWTIAMAWDEPTSHTVAGPGPWHLLQYQWLTQVSFVTYLFVWIVYVPSWVAPWLQRRHPVKM